MKKVISLVLLGLVSGSYAIDKGPADDNPHPSTPEQTQPAVPRPVPNFSTSGALVQRTLEKSRLEELYKRINTVKRHHRLYKQGHLLTVARVDDNAARREKRAKKLAVIFKGQGANGLGGSCASEASLFNPLRNDRFDGGGPAGGQGGSGLAA